MPRLRRSLLGCVSSDDGMTLIELSTALGLLGVVVAALLTVMYSAQTNLDRQISRSSTNDQLRLAAESLDREVRSGEVLYDPGTENYSPGDVATGMSLRIFTRSNAPTRGGSRCVQWRLTSTGLLQERNWDPNWQTSPSTLVTGWRTVATNVTNRTDGVAAFSRPASGNIATVNVDFRANDEASKGSTVELKESISGRNTQLNRGVGFDQTCGPITPDPSLSSGSFQVPPY